MNDGAMSTWHRLGWMRFVFKASVCLVILNILMQVFMLEWHFVHFWFLFWVFCGFIENPP